MQVVPQSLLRSYLPYLLIYLFCMLFLVFNQSTIVPPHNRQRGLLSLPVCSSVQNFTTVQFHTYCTLSRECALSKVHTSYALLNHPFSINDRHVSEIWLEISIILPLATIRWRRVYIQTIKCVTSTLSHLILQRYVAKTRPSISKPQLECFQINICVYLCYEGFLLQSSSLCARIFSLKMKLR